jgi:S1-C subfamily serine protease
MEKQKHYSFAWIPLSVLAVAIACQGQNGAPAAVLTQPQVAGILDSEELDTIALFEKASPAVVHIHTSEVVRSPFSRRIREEFTGSGSGFVWDNSGHVVTNYHVIQGANRALVTLVDGTTLEAELVGAEPTKDLAVLKIKHPSRSLTSLPVGTSANLRVGQKVFAIGNPFGLDHTLTTGIISGLDREIVGVAGNRLRQVVQTDAAINPGNSGGPLLNSSGQLIGVNTAIKSPSGASAGIGFAVPVDSVHRVVSALIENGEIPHASLGLSVIPSRWSRARGVIGLMIADMKSEGPAARAGLTPAQQSKTGRILVGDVLLAIDQQPLRSESDLILALASYEPGEKIQLTIARNGKEKVLTITLDQD